MNIHDVYVVYLSPKKRIGGCIVIKSNMLHEQRTTAASTADSFYELDTARYPSLGSEFFTRLREKYPRAFRRSVPRNVHSSVRSSRSSTDSSSIWSLWECNGDYDKAVVKEAGGVLIPCSDLPVHERLKMNCDSFSSVKATCDDLLVTLRNFRSALITESKSVISQHAAGDSGTGPSSAGAAHVSLHERKDAVSNQSTSNSVSPNSCSETKSLQHLSRNDAAACSETLGMSSFQSAGNDLIPETIGSATVTDATLNTDRDMLRMQLIDVGDSDPVVQQDTKKQTLINTAEERNDALLVKSSQIDANHRCEKSQTKMQDNSAGTEAVYQDDNCSDIQHHHISADEHQTDALSASYQSLSGHHTVTDRKPPLMKKGKTHQRNIKSVFGQNTGNPNSSSNFVLNDNWPEAPGSAEVVRRKLRLPWKKKKKHYLPGEEASRWRSSFESWRSASVESVSAGDRELWRPASHSELHDSVSASWTDSEADTMSDDPTNNTVRRLSSHSIDISTDTQQSSWRSSLRSSAHKRLSSLQRAAGKRLLRLQKAVSLGHNEHDSSDNDFTSEQTTNINESTQKRVQHFSDSSTLPSRHVDIENPQHFRPIGCVLSHSDTDGTTTIELIRPPHGPYGIYLARDGDHLHSKMYISRLSDGLPVHFYAGLLQVGDEVIKVNDVAVSGLSLDNVFDMIAQSSTLVLQLRPSSAAESV